MDANRERRVRPRYVHRRRNGGPGGVWPDPVQATMGELEGSMPCAASLLWISTESSVPTTIRAGTCRASLHSFLRRTRRHDDGHVRKIHWHAVGGPNIHREIVRDAHACGERLWSKERTPQPRWEGPEPSRASQAYHVKRAFRVLTCPSTPRPSSAFSLAPSAHSYRLLPDLPGGRSASMPSKGIGLRLMHCPVRSVERPGSGSPNVGGEGLQTRTAESPLSPPATDTAADRPRSNLAKRLFRIHLPFRRLRRQLYAQPRVGQTGEAASRPGEP
jgi:hypothetical protein